DPRLEGIVMEQMAVTETELHFPLRFVPLPEGFRGVIHEDKRTIVEAFPVSHRIPTFGFLFRERPRLRKVLAEKLSGVEVPVEAWDRIRAGEDFTDASGRVFPNAYITQPPPPPRSYAFVTDTLYDPSLTAFVHGADLLYHEATFLHEMEEVAREKFHATAHQAGLFARDAGVRQLLIGHFSARYRDLQPLLEEARAVFPFTQVGTEGTVIDIDRIG
ncbi:MAG TPA: MBL fold metallo-hydrolase, partial [Bacteroidales bacterium]|nr:MBL fold metallo-hydrolase [Bacteroidales bacterium]